MPPGRKPRVSARTFAQYATHGVRGWLGWGGDDDVPCTCNWWGGWGGWGWWCSLHLHTCVMLCNWWAGVGGDDDAPCTCTHVWCYATDGWGWVWMMMFLALAHMCDAAQLMGGGGWGWWCSLHLHTCGSLRSVLALRHTSGQDVTQEKPASKISTPL